MHYALSSSCTLSSSAGHTPVVQQIAAALEFADQWLKKVLTAVTSSIAVNAFTV
jgi:hypothetical protein